MSTFTRRAGGTPFLRHVHLKAGIEVPRARLLYMNEERCAPAAPPGRTRARPLAASAARSGPLRCMRMHSRTKMTSGGQSIYTSQRRGARRGSRKKRVFRPNQIFLANSPAHAACA